MSRQPSYVSDFIRACRDDSTTPPAADGTPRFFIPYAKEGALYLSEENERAYAATTRRLLKQFSKRDDLSVRTVEGFLKQAIFSALDPKQKSKLQFDQRLHDAVTHLNKQLTKPRKLFTCYFPVSGADGENLPVRFGKIRLIKSGKSHERILLRRARSKVFKDIIRALRDIEVWNQPYAIVNVHAHDDDAAAVVAKSTIRSALDCINFFDDLIPYNHAWLHFPAEGAHALEAAPILCDDGSFSLPHTATGPIGTFAFDNVRKVPVVLKCWNAVSKLARTTRPNTGGDVIISAIQWAGRACVEPRREQSFLLFAIALESAMLPKKGQELNYRLGLRIARLLGRKRKERDELKQLVSHLYDVRSKIVHSGSFEVTDEDLGGVRLLAKRVLLQLVGKRRFWGRRVDALESWLETLGRG